VSLASSFVALVAAVVLTALPVDAAPGDLHRVPPDVEAAARNTGAVRVIVKVDQPAGTPIDRAQDAVIAELTGTSCRILHRYLTSPFLALEVGLDALRVLDHSSHVVSVTADFEMRPQTPGATR